MKGACVYMKFIPEPLVPKCQQCQQCSQFSEFLPVKYKFIPVKYKFIPVKYKFPNFYPLNTNFYPLNTNLNTNFRTDSNTSYRYSNHLCTMGCKLLFLMCSYREKYKWWHNILLTCHKIRNLVFMHLDDLFSVSMSPSRCTLYTYQ